MCPRAISIEFEFGISCWFLKRGETRVPGEKPLGARERTNAKLLVFISQFGENTLTFDQKHQKETIRTLELNLKDNYKAFFSFVVHIHANLFLTYETGEWKA